MDIPANGSSGPSYSIGGGGGSVSSSAGTAASNGKSRSNTVSNSAAKKTATTVIAPNSFIDTGAILVLFSCLPSYLMVFIHCIFITGSANSMLKMQSLVLDFVFAIFTLYLCPQLKHVMMIFANAIIASTLGGGSKSFTNAIYSTTLIELGRLITQKVDNQTRSFNTWSMMSRLYKSLKRIQWKQDMPIICLQMICVHVVFMGMFPFFRKVFPDRYNNSNQSSNSHQSHNDWQVDDADLVNTQSTVISYSDQAESIDKSLASDLNILSPPKRNKKLATVRLNQPLWSTLASSMILAARQESERKSVKAEPELEDGDDKKNILGNCLIRFITDNLIAFEMSEFDIKTKDSFVVRVNGIQWPQSTVYSFDNPTDPFLVVMHGLTPMTQYEVEICITGNHENNICCAKVDVCTSSSTSHAVPNISRPLSPVTTLLDTLTGLQTTLSDQKSTLRKARKDNSKKLAQLRNEIDQVKSKLGGDYNNNKNDERNRRKVLSLRDTVRQMTEQVDQLSAKIDRFDSDSADKQYIDLKQQYQSFVSSRKNHEEDRAILGASLDKKLKELENDLSLLQSKYDKLDTKRDRLKGDTEVIVTQDCMQELEAEMERMRVARQPRLKHRESLRTEFADAITKMDNNSEMNRNKMQQFYLMIHQLTSSPSSQNETHSNNVSPRDSLS